MAVNVNVPTWFLQQYRVKRLSDAALATWVKVAAWCVTNYNSEYKDGHFPKDITHIETSINRDAMNELHKAGFITDTDNPDVMFLVDYPETQSSFAEIQRSVEARRASDAARKRRQREREKNDAGDDEPDQVESWNVATVPESRDSHGYQSQGQSRDSHADIEKNTAERANKAGVTGQSRDMSRDSPQSQVSIKALDKGTLEPPTKNEPTGQPANAWCADDDCVSEVFGTTGYCFEHNQQRLLHRAA